MTCKSVEMRLGAYMDGELNGAEMLQVRRHMAHCDRCTELLEQHRQLKLSLAVMHDVAPSRELEERIVSAVMRSSAPKPKYLKAPFAYAVVTVAAATWLVSLAVQGNRQRTMDAQRLMDQQAFEMARHQADLRRSDPLMGDSGVLLVNHGR